MVSWLVLVFLCIVPLTCAYQYQVKPTTDPCVEKPIEIDCDNNPCQNTASCVDEGDSDYCLCLGPFFGKFCENTEAIDCSTLNPCFNGECNVDTCDCDACYTGVVCQNLDPDCQA